MYKNVCFWSIAYSSEWMFISNRYKHQQTPKQTQRIGRMQVRKHMHKVKQMLLENNAHKIMSL